MRLTNLTAATAALSLVASPVVAAPSNPAAKLSLAGAAGQTTTPSMNTEKSDSQWLLIGGLVLVAVIVAAVVLGGGGGDKDSKPASS